MAQGFLFLLSLYLSGFHIGHCKNLPPLALLSEFGSEIWSSSLSKSIQENDCGLNCDMLIQTSDLIDSDPFESLLKELSDHNDSIYNKSEEVYMTLKNLKEEINYLEALLGKMEEVKPELDSGLFDLKMKDLSTQITSQKINLEKMSSEHLVLVVKNGEETFITTQDFKYQQRKSKLEKNVERFMKNSMNSTELYELYDSLQILQSEMRKDDSCEIQSVVYSYSDLVTFTESIEDLAKSTEHDETLLSAADHLENLKFSSGQYWLKSELKDFLDAWGQIIKLLNPGETITIMGEDFDLLTLKEKYDELKGVFQKLHIGEVATFNEKGDLEVVVTPLVKSSDHLKGPDYFDLVKSSASRENHVPIISTDVIFTELSAPDGLLLKFEGISQPATFLQSEDRRPHNDLKRKSKDAPKEPQVKGNEYHDGELKIVFITTFLGNSTGTGKIFAFEAKNPKNYVELLNGFDKPTGVCYDINHDFFYVVESDGKGSGIYQFQVDRNEDSFKFNNRVYVVVYSGKPQDCKVDGYGNLYFTEKSDQSIKKMIYSDLYFAYTNSEVTVYSDGYGLDYPTSLELFESSSLFYINSGSSMYDGSVNEANVLIDDFHPKDIKILIQEKFPAVSLAVTHKRIFYSLENGGIKSFNKETKEIFTYSRELEEPKGICGSDGRVFALDYSQGVVFVGDDDFIEDMKVFSYVQAPYSCFCLNFKDSSSFEGFLVVGLIVFIVF